MGLVHLKSHYRVDPLLEFDSLKDVVDSSSRNVNFLNHKSRKTFDVFSTNLKKKKGPRHLFFNRLEECPLKLVVHEG
jgi:hypothetical protein